MIFYSISFAGGVFLAMNSGLTGSYTREKLNVY